MKHIYDSLFLKDKDGVRREPDAEALIYKNGDGNELWIRIYEWPDGYCIATTLSRFPKLGYEVELEYDSGKPPMDVDPLEACIEGMRRYWKIPEDFFSVALAELKKALSEGGEDGD
jgi:hypothetical protein